LEIQMSTHQATGPEVHSAAHTQHDGVGGPGPASRGKTERPAQPTEPGHWLPRKFGLLDRSCHFRIAPDDGEPTRDFC
jgi:hypothetical protein